MDDPSRARVRRRPSSGSSGEESRRPGEEIPKSEQPAEKVLKRENPFATNQGEASSSPREPRPSTSGIGSERRPSGAGAAGREHSSSSPREPRPGPSGGNGSERRPSGVGAAGRDHSSSSPREPRPGPSGGNGPDRRPGEGGAAGGDRGGRNRRERYELVHTRPQDITEKLGSSGKPIILKSNYYRLMTKPTWRIFQYHVDFSPPIEMIRVRSGVLSEHKAILGGYIFDGTKIFTTTKLREDRQVLVTKSRSGEIYNITVRYVGIISMTEWQSLQVLNLILRRAMQGLKLQLVGRNFFDALAKIDIREHRLQLWPGYVTSIRQHEKDIMVCTEIAHKVMRTETVYDILMKATQQSRDFHDNFKREVLGLTVLTDYNNKTYRIDDVDFTMNPKKTFSCKNVETSFVDYYYSKYNIRIRDPNQPLLISKPRERQVRGGRDETVILIPELCRATGITDAMKSNFQLTRAMSDHTRMNPDRRIERLKAFNRRLQGTDSSMSILRDWNMRLDTELVEVKGRVIAPQSIYFSENNKVSAGDNADWTRHFRDNALFKTPRDGLINWSVITPQRNVRECRAFVDSLIRAASGMRLRISRPNEIVMFDDRTQSYLKAIDESANTDPQLIMCLLASNNSADKYGAIKKRTCVERAIPTQVITQRTAGNQRGLMSIATKVAIQINCKLGYSPWKISLPLNGLMTIGYDISKSSKDRSKAYGALVATMDLNAKPIFYSTISPCHSADDLSNELTINVIKALRRYEEEHNDLPTRILLYRDGVGEGSLNQLMEMEVKTLVEKLEDIYSKPRIRHDKSIREAKKLMFAFIVVSKSSNTRLFANGRNPPPGTVVDDVITLPERYDYFLVSQSVRQGTVSPTNYNVVHSTFGLTPDHMQMLTYKFCHLYFNWSGTTRVPAVCQYAKKLATLISQSIHNIPSTALEKKLYYL